MSDKPAVIQGCYVDCRFMPGLKSARISVDIPIEHANEFLRMFGAPDRAAPVSVVIARMTSGLGRSNENGPETASAGAPASPSASVQGQGKPKHSYTLANKAGMLIKDPQFQEWMFHTYPPADIAGIELFGHNPERWTDLALKRVLLIDSKTVLDHDPKKIDAFLRLETSFRFRDQVRA